jgi:DNA-binding HxlR family transcriptional regulator
MSTNLLSKKVIIVAIYSREAVRFSELKKALVDISSTMLFERLLELEQEWLVAKKSMAQRLNIA